MFHILYCLWTLILVVVINKNIVIFNIVIYYIDCLLKLDVPITILITSTHTYYLMRNTINNVNIIMQIIATLNKN